MKKTVLITKTNGKGEIIEVEEPIFLGDSNQKKLRKGGNNRKKRKRK